MKTTMFRRLALSAAVAAPLVLSTSLASAGWSQHNHPDSKQLLYQFVSSNSKSTTFAGRKFAIGYTSSLNAVARHIPSTRSGYAAGNLDVPVTFFGKDAKLFGARASGLVYVSTTPGSQPHYSSDFEIRVLGSVVKSGPIKLNHNGPLASYSKSLLSVESTVLVYGFPVTFTADATGTLSLNGAFSWSNGKLSLGVTPGAAVDAAGSAAVGGTWHGIGLEGGVETNMAVLDASVPLTGWMKPLTQAVQVGASGSLELSGMSGDFGVFAKACAGPFGCLEKHASIFSWGGASYSVPAFNVSKTVNF